MKRLIFRVFILACVTVAGVALHAQQPSPAPADLAVVVAVMRDPAATPVQKDRLIGKVYTGVVSIEAVRLSEPFVSVWAKLVEPASTGPAPAVVRLTFAGRADDERVQRLRSGQHVHVHGTLKDLTSAQAGMPVANFTELVIDGPAK